MFPNQPDNPLIYRNGCAKYEHHWTLAPDPEEAGCHLVEVATVDRKNARWFARWDRIKAEPLSNVLQGEIWILHVAAIGIPFEQLEASGKAAFQHLAVGNSWQRL